MKVIDHFHNFIDPLPRATREQLLSDSYEREYRRGEALYAQGEESLAVFQLLSGQVRLCNFSAAGKEVIMGHFRPGDCFGEMGVIDGMERVSHCIAVQDCRVRVIGRDHFMSMYRESPIFLQALNLVFCRRMRLLYALTEDASALSLHERLARYIHRLSYSHALLDESEEAYLDFSHEDIGRALGATRQSVSKELRKLEQLGAIALRYGRIYIRELDALQDNYETLLGQELLTAATDDHPQG